MSIKRDLASNAFWSLVGHVLARGSLVVASIVLARELTTAAFAAYSYFQLTTAMLAAYAALGLGATASRFFAEVDCDGEVLDSKPLGTLFSASLLISLAVFVAILVIPEKWLSASLDVPKWLLAAGIGATALGVVPAGALVGLERYRMAALASLAYGAIVVVGALLAAKYKSPLVAMTALGVAALVKAGWQCGAVLQVVGWRRIACNLWITRDSLLSVMRFAGPMFFVTLLSASGSWVIGRIVLLGEDGVYEFALYSIGLQWYALGLLVPGMVSRVLLPRLIRASGEHHGQQSVIIRFTALLSVCASLVVCLLVALGWPILSGLYGARYAIAPLFIAAYMGAAIISAPANTFGNALLASNQQWTWLAQIFVWFVILSLIAVLGVYSGLGGRTGALAHGIAGFVLWGSAYLACRRLRLV